MNEVDFKEGSSYIVKIFFYNLEQIITHCSYLVWIASDDLLKMEQRPTFGKTLGTTMVP